MKRDKIISLLNILLIIFLFILFPYLVQTNTAIFSDIQKNNFISIISYISLLIISVVVAPVSTFPLIAIASNIWGWVYAGLFSIVGWSIGAGISFVIARRWGVPLVEKFVSLKKIELVEKKIPEKNMFWSIVFLRMIIPVDVLSYALGLFSKVDFRTYMPATILGIAPFAFIFAYLGVISFYYQIFAFIAIFIFIGVMYWFYFRKSLRKRNQSVA